MGASVRFFQVLQICRRYMTYRYTIGLEFRVHVQLDLYVSHVVNSVNVKYGIVILRTSNYSNACQTVTS